MYSNLTKDAWADPARVELLKKLWADSRLPVSYIAGELGVSRNSIIGKVNRLGLPKRREAHVRKTNRAADKGRSAAMRIKKLRVRGPSHGGTVVVESVVREPVPTPASFLGIPLLDLAQDQCRFTNSESAPYLFCGNPVIPGQSWCRSCSRIVFTHTPPPPPSRPYLPIGGSKPRVF